MNEFENKVLSLLGDMKSDISNINTRIDKIETDISDLKDDVSSLEKKVTTIKRDVSKIKKEAEITRVAANYNGEKLDELYEELKAVNVLD